MLIMKREDSRRRRKKQETADIEEINTHRILISDDQLQLQYAREMRAASSREILNPSMLEKVSLSGISGISGISGMGSVAASGCCDIVYVSELGSGINRGAMNFGRLYQGKYVPPDRIDIVSKKNDDDDDEVSTEADLKNMICEEPKIFTDDIDDDTIEGKHEDSSNDADLDLD